MAAKFQCSFSPTIDSFRSNRTLKSHQPIDSLRRLSFCKPISFSIANPRLTISHTKAVSARSSCRLSVVSGLVDGNSETCPESESSETNEGATIDVKLPRRSLLVQFTCDDCGERTQRLINRLAYERGLVFVQCAGCERYHKLADNLGLVVEYDLREEISAESNGDKD